LPSPIGCAKDCARVIPMTTDTPVLARSPPPLSLLWQGSTLPVVIILFAILLVWYLAAVWLNAPFILDATPDLAFRDLLEAAWSAERPLLPAPHQVLVELWKTVAETAVTSKRSLLYHSWITLSSSLLGFVFGSALGILLAVAIVHVKSLEKSLLPWIIASQTVPILAIAPIIIVALGSLGIVGLVPKSIISAYLCFFPVTIGMVKGLTSPDIMQLDLMRTYNAGRWQTFCKLRWPAAVPFLFASFKVAIAISLVGAIVGELPTGAQAGLGARLLAGSYYGQTVQIWAALLAAATIAAAMVASVGIAERFSLKQMGIKP
jgi:NitT/TauT family transport system permease protein